MNEDFERRMSLDLTLGHLLVVWELLSSKLSGSPANQQFSEQEKRAIWILADICEVKLVEAGIAGRPAPEWDKLVEKAGEFVNSLPCDFA